MKTFVRMKTRFFAIAALCVVCVFFCASPLFAETATLPKALEAQLSSAQSADEAVSVLQKALEASPPPSASDRMKIASRLAALYEQMGRFQEAQLQYSIAVNASATVNNAVGKGPKAEPEYLLGAVRTALSTGDTPLADYLLSTAFTGETDAEVLAYVRLYALWSWFCKVGDESECAQPLALLKGYVNQSAMKSVKPQMLLTLWYVTGDAGYAAQLAREFPQSVECGVASGAVQLMPRPFWYFLPAKAPSTEQPPAPAPQTSAGSQTSASTQGDGTQRSGAPAKTSTAPQTSTAPETSTAVEQESDTPLYYQLGFFRNSDNAQALVERVKQAGFAAEIRKETRSGGNVFYAVIAEENQKGTMGQELKNAGFECYPVYR